MGKPTVLIMAAGHGTRMRSAAPKVLHPVCGRPMIHWVIEAARAAGAGRVVCVTRPGEGVEEVLPDGVEAAPQITGEGTGSAVLAARDGITPDTTIVVLSGDHPLITAELTHDILSSIGVNTRADLMEVERHLSQRLIEEHALNGVTFTSPHTTTIEADVEIGEDTVVGPGVTIQAGTRIGKGCEIGPHTTLINARLADGVWVAHSYLVECEIHDNAKIGPFAY